MKVLVGCESSGVVREAFRARGHDAWSCDLLPSADASPHHLQSDLLEVLDPVLGGRWDLLIAHPPCTYLSSSGLHWNARVPGRPQKTLEALEFVRALMDAPVLRIAIENPVGRIGTAIRKSDQIIQPYHFGHDASKKTCPWLTHLPLLQGTRFVPPHFGCEKCCLKFALSRGERGCPRCHGETGKARHVWDNQTCSGQNALAPSASRWSERSRTYEGIAQAMAEQWG